MTGKEGLITEADIAARRRELETAREDDHKRQIQDLEAKIRGLEAKKRDLDLRGQDDLHKLNLGRQDAEEKLRACKEQQRQCLQDLKESHEREVERYKTDWREGHLALSEGHGRLTEKQSLVSALEKKGRHDQEVEHGQATLHQLIKEEQAKLDKIEKEYGDLKKHHKEESDAKMQTFKEESDRLQRQIGNVNKQVEERKRRNKKAEAEESRRRGLQQPDVDKKLSEREKWMAPLLRNKEKLSKKNKEILDKIKEIKAKEEERTEKLLKQSEDTFRENELQLDRDRERDMKHIAEKEGLIKKRELELAELKADLKRNGAEKSVQSGQPAVSSNSSDESQQLEVAIQQKSCDLQSMEANQMAEEALLRFNLVNISERLKSWQEELAVKQDEHSAGMKRLEAGLTDDRLKAENERKGFEQVQLDLENKLREKEFELGERTREATTHLNDLNRQMADLKSGLKRKEDTLVEASERDRLIQEDVDKSESEQQSLREKLERKKEEEDAERHKDQLLQLQTLQQAETKEHEAVIDEMSSLLDSMRNQFTEERQSLKQYLEKLLKSNDILRKKHEHDLLEMKQALAKQAKIRRETEDLTRSGEKKLHDTVKELETEKSRSIDLADDLKLKKEQLNSLMNRREAEIEKLSHRREINRKQESSPHPQSREMITFEEECSTQQHKKEKQEPIADILTSLEKKEQALRELNSSAVSIGGVPENHNIARVKGQLKVLRDRSPMVVAEKVEVIAMEASNTRGMKAAEVKTEIICKNEDVRLTSRTYDKEMSLQEPSVSHVEEKSMTSDNA